MIGTSYQLSVSIVLSYGVFYKHYQLVRQNLGEFEVDLELDFKLFSLLILVVHTLCLNNLSDATLTSLSISIYPRWCPRWRTIISEKIV